MRENWRPLKSTSDELEVFCRSLRSCRVGSNRNPEITPSAYRAKTNSLGGGRNFSLDKLRQPQIDDSRLVQAQSWWRSLQRSYAGQSIEFREGEIGNQASLPQVLFDRAADNLIQNAIGKRKQQGDFAISVSFACGDTARLEVCDGGRAIAVDTATELLRGPVPSESGLGIGLYQVARHAEVSGFSLALAHNADGKVCFLLAGALKPAVEPAAA